MFSHPAPAYTQEAPAYLLLSLIARDQYWMADLGIMKLMATALFIEGQVTLPCSTTLGILFGKAH